LQTKPNFQHSTALSTVFFRSLCPNLNQASINSRFTHHLRPTTGFIPLALRLCHRTMYPNRDIHMTEWVMSSARLLIGMIGADKGKDHSYAGRAEPCPQTQSATPFGVK